MYKVDVSCKEDSVFEVKSDEANFTVDLTGNNMSPLHMLLAALGSCTGAFLRRYAESMKLPIKDFAISIEAELVKEPQMSFRQINVAIDLKGVQLDQAKKEGLLRFVNNCPVQNTLHGNPKIEVKLN